VSESKRERGSEVRGEVGVEGKDGRDIRSGANR